jgi:hypothetical protein
MIMSLKVPEGDEGMSENEYKAIYCIYKNLLTGLGGIAFIITGDKLNTENGLFEEYINKFGEPGRLFNSGPLNLSLDKNIITHVYFFVNVLQKFNFCYVWAVVRRYQLRNIRLY